MANTPTTNEILVIPDENDPDWNEPLDQNWEDIDSFLAATVSVDAAGTGTLALTANQCKGRILDITGILTGNRVVTLPHGGVWLVKNGTTGAFTLTLKNADNGADTGLEVVQGQWAFYAIAPNGATGTSRGSTLALYDADIAAIAALTTTSFGRARLTDADAAALRTAAALGSLATASSVNNDNWSGTDLSLANGGTGASDASGARSNLGLGSIATQAASAVAITGGSVTGITDITVADGGTGASDAANARSNLGIGSMATRAVTISTSDPSGGSDGDVWFKYTP